ncbi:uncharacterized protein J3D65DRAFT_269095 [Phyllosticta citribraziliensis]|uniref:BZIP domain-containing protein n=1 Tax=Phyllosticta citribraziliensis TaxID=989973 RepID=A0ABR1M111_9PEZI
MAGDLDNLDDFPFDAVPPGPDDGSLLTSFSSPALMALPSSLPPQQPQDVVPLSTGTLSPELQTVHPQALFTPQGMAWPAPDPRDSYLHLRASSSSASSAPTPQALAIQGGGTHSTFDGRERSLPARSSSSAAPLPLHHGTAREKHGQYTPDSDNTPKRDTQPRRLRSHTTGGQSNSPDQIQRGNGMNRKREASSEGKSSTSSPRTRSRKNSTVEPSEDLDADEQLKREHFLERNRMAAHKCRQKKKEWVVSLDERCRALQADNTILHARRTALLSELFDLKNAAFAHSDCRYGPIDRFIEVEASKSKSITVEADPTKVGRSNLLRPPR